MTTIAHTNQRFSFKELIDALVDSAADATQRLAVARILPRLEEYAETHLEEAQSRVEVRSHLSEAFLVTLGPDAARSELEKVVNDARSIEDPMQRAAAIADAAHHAGTLGGLGTDLLDRMTELAAGFEPGEPKAHLFAAISVAFNRARDSKKAGKLAIRALNTAEKPADVEERVAALTAVAMELIKIGPTSDVSEALERAGVLAESIQDEVSRCRAFVNLAAALCRVGRGEEGLTALNHVFGNGSAKAKSAAPEEAVAQTPEPKAGEPEMAAAEAELASPPEEEQASKPTNGTSTFLEEPPQLDDSWNDPTRGVAFPSFTGSRRKRR
ncbi:MAG: hypothetical protein V2A76_01630 [Planctomycetota bacterium]